METHYSSTSIPTSFAAACAECGYASHDRQYVHLADRHTCEHCFLDSRKRRHNLENDSYELFVESLAGAMDLREKETGLHSKRVATHTLLLASHHYKKDKDLKEIYWGSLLHDIGKIGVPDSILLKPGQLSGDEWHIMQEHPRNGHQILQKLTFLTMAADIVLCHEERFDGSGYPSGLKGEEIPLGARLFAIIDTLDAMTFDRPYRKALSFDVAKAEIIRMAGSQFDPIAVETFLREEAGLREMTTMEFPQPKS